MNKFNIPPISAIHGGGYTYMTCSRQREGDWGNGQPVMPPQQRRILYRLS